MEFFLLPLQVYRIKAIIFGKNASDKVPSMLQEMWTSCTILFTTVLIFNAESDDPRLKQITDVVFGVQQHLYSGCVSLIISSAQEGKRESEGDSFRCTKFRRFNI
jgi:hypothetical protein